MRGWISNAGNYSDPVPIGGVMRSLAAAQANPLPAQDDLAQRGAGLQRDVFLRPGLERAQAMAARRQVAELSQPLARRQTALQPAVRRRHRPVQAVLAAAQSTHPGGRQATEDRKSGAEGRTVAERLEFVGGRND